jgi:IS1 family transposase
MTAQAYTYNMNKLNPDKQAQVIAALVEGNSIRATVRMTGVAKGTVLSLLARVGRACSEYQDKVFVNLPCERLQCDEIWAFCYAKEKNVPEEMRGEWGYGDVWTFTAICADTKLVPSWYLGHRNSHDATIFMQDLASRLNHRVQLTTDNHRMYFSAVDDAFGSDVDYSMLSKIYGPDPEGEKRYSPPMCLGVEVKDIKGQPDRDHVSTSYVERQNLTMRMAMRRFTRLTNGFSKKVENLEHAVALHFMHYNFCRIHQSLRITPAMAAGVTDNVWDISDIIKLIP